MDDKSTSSKTYPTYKGLAELAGLCRMDEALQPGISVEECVQRLKRFHYAFKRLHEILTKRITAEPIYELKMAYSYHAYLCAEHVTALRTRVAEMREPPLGLEAVPDPNLEVFFDEIQAAPGSEALVAGLYGRAVPALIRALERHIANTHPLADAPSVRICRFARLELEDMAAFGQRAIESLVNPDRENELSPWLELLDQCLLAAGALDGAQPKAGSMIARQYSKQPYEYDKTPRRDERFVDRYNMGVNAEAFLYDEKYASRPKVLMLYFKRLREIDVPEMMASILAETQGKPWEYYRDMSRQLWDEARHAMMGEVGFASLDLAWSELVRVNFTWSLSLNTQLEALERHAVLYFIEQGLMPRTGKRFEWEIATQSGDALARVFQDYDWADEVLHARIGQDWYVVSMPSRAAALTYGDDCWSKVFMNWNRWKEEGLTEHFNWWPGLYQAACERWGIEPDPQVLAFNETYEEKRADLKKISGSA
jgi:hypothetical protein